ncbi:hypothetical protein CYMTET_24558 [Cymbomonas tetramitiformis]|uniref:Uncharacterized protein n=1 Tax=Cymbomonas tetramitiformis TaxID=36881 RepID=A0AAE0FWG1_9CHLO|nr:hypothetical protein CYMTET_24558 [Cymbomonas tetramitiformis]
MFEAHLEFIEHKYSYTQTWRLLNTEEDAESAEKRNPNQGTDDNALQCKNLVIQGIFSSSITKAVAYELPPSTPFEFTIFFHIELAIERLRQSLFHPLELFIYSIPIIRGGSDFKDEVPIQEGHSRTTLASSSSNNVMSLRRFKIAFFRFCFEQGVPTSNIGEKEVEMMNTAGLKIVKDPFSEVYFSGLRWQEHQDSALGADAGCGDGLTDSVTLFLESHCIATHIETDQISLQSFALRYKQFCYSMKLPKTQQAQITPNTPQVVHFGGIYWNLQCLLISLM